MATRKTRTAAPKRTSTTSKTTTPTRTTRSLTSRASRAGAQYELKPTRDQIARRAYEIWLNTGRAAGRDELNWLLAEKELAGK